MGALVGDRVVTGMVGVFDGGDEIDGLAVGEMVGGLDGMLDGFIEGGREIEGACEGWGEMEGIGEMEGVKEGTSVLVVGLEEGAALGALLGNAKGFTTGLVLGLIVRGLGKVGALLGVSVVSLSHASSEHLIWSPESDRSFD